MGSLGSLRYLNLSRSGFVGTIPLQLGNLTELRTLCLGSFNEDVYAYEYTSMTSIRWLSSLRRLHHLDLSGVDLRKAIDWLEVINTLPSLVKLHLSSSELLHIHPHVSSLNLTSLSLLDLSKNHFNDSFVPRWIFSITGLVSLDLSWCGLQGLIPSSIHSFGNLTSLELLHVPRNDFMSSSLVLEGLSTIGSSLISLDISSCGVPSSILDSLQNLTSLLVLQMSGNQLTKPLPKSLGNLCNLLHVDMGENDFSNISLTILLDSFWECKSPSLESLSLYSSELSCILPDQLGQLTYLVQLQLGNNRINGTIPDSIGKLSFLRSLDLGWNLISGPILFPILGLSSLELLDLSNNQLNDSLPHSLGQLSMLNTLDVSSNLLTGVMTEYHFAKLTNLKYLLGNGNKLTLRPRMGNWIPPFKLRSLCLSSWDLGPQFPLWLLLQEDLVHLEISNTMIPSTLPEPFWRSFPNLRYLDMSQNQIEGRLLGIPETLWHINLSSNKFSGQLPELSNSSSAMMLYLSNNSFVGSLHNLLCPYGYRTLESLDLANNHLSGVIPECWVKLPFLGYLRLDNNHLFGKIPRTLGSVSSLRSLNMCNNKLSGGLPVSLKNLMNLQILQLSGNELDGKIPAWLGREFSSLRILNLRSNHFEGHINDELCHVTTLQILDLADNNLSGNIPRCFNNFRVLSGKETSLTKEFEVSSLFGSSFGSASLVIKGREDTYSSILGFVLILDLSSNNFSGSIPIELMSLKALQSVNLSRNRLMGSIPEKIGDLKLLESFDVSWNRLSGELPATLSGLSFLSFFNVSYNNLVGRVPSSTQLQSFNESSFMGNKLCGDPLIESCTVKVPADRDQEAENRGADWGLITSIVAGFIVGFWAVLAPLIVSTTWRIAYFNFLRDMRFMLYGAIRKYCCNIFHK